MDTLLVGNSPFFALIPSVPDHPGKHHQAGLCIHRGLRNSQNEDRSQRLGSVSAPCLVKIGKDTVSSASIEEDAPVVEGYILQQNVFIHSILAQLPDDD